MGIYVEILIRGPMEHLWEKTQNPALHQRWDLRFTEISYLPRPDETQPQQFLYTTCIGFGLKIQGKGESLEKYDEVSGRRTSALKFWSDDPKSLIKVGSGYWQYNPTSDGIQFLTWYDYETRFGQAGRLFDRFIFRPLIGWATAWSFDRLRLWIEKGIDPAVAARTSLTHGLARWGLASIWIYQGLIPKVIFRHEDEIQMMHDAGIPRETAQFLVPIVGIIEAVFGLGMIRGWRNRWLFPANIGLMLLATWAVTRNSPRYFRTAFNPFSLNLAVILLSIIGWLASIGNPSASQCLRNREEQ